MASTPNEMTPEEILAVLKRTSLPTIVVEGNDDMIVYRTFEAKLAHLRVSVLPVGGRQKVLEVFRRRTELRPSFQPFFIADQDTWVISGVPSEYVDSSIAFTHGYSIENDIYIDGDLRKLLQGTECTRYEMELADFIEWYALALYRHLRDPTYQIALHPKQVLDLSQRPTLLALLPTETYPTELRNSVTQDYQRLLRGKSLLDLLVKNTNYKGREPRHSNSALLEAVAVRPGALLDRLYRIVEQHFLALGTPT